MKHDISVEQRGPGPIMFRPLTLDGWLWCDANLPEMKDGVFPVTPNVSGPFARDARQDGLRIQLVSYPTFGA